jgi:DNA-binding response OmpR family regulator
MRILIIENSDTIRQMLETLVSAPGHEVDAVPSGTKGIDIALSRTPDAILLDMDIPEPYGGVEVCRRLRETADTRYVPIIAISSLTDDASKERALEAGAGAYYTKPFSPTALLKEIESIGARESTKLQVAPNVLK